MSQTTPFGLILLLWGAGLGAAGQYAKVSVIYDMLPTVYPDAGVALGFIVSVVGFVGIVLGVVAGVLVGRIGFRRALIWALWFGAALSALQALFPPIWLMLVLRMLEGVSHLAIVVAIPTLFAQLSAARHRGFTLTLWSTFFSVAFTLLVWLGLPLVARFGLGSLFLAHAIWMAAFAVILSGRLRQLPTTRDTSPLSVGQMARDHVTLYRSPFMVAPATGWLFYTFCYLALLTLLPPFIPEGQRAIVLGAMPLVSIAVSMTFGVALLRWISAVQVVMLGFVMVVICLCWLLIAPGMPAACLALAAALGLVQGASFAAVPQLNDTAQTQAKANGAMAQMGNVGNTMGTPILAAVLMGTGYKGMLAVSVVVTLCGLAAHMCLARLRRI